jgi:serine/threonine-protein kinase RsbW
MKEGFTIIDELTIPSVFEEVHKVEGMVDRACSTIGVDEENYGNVLIAVTEAVNNAIEHGNKKSKELDVYVAVADEANSFCFSVVDRGSGFDFNNLPDPTAPENILKENGRGIFLMRSLADEVCFENNGSRVNIFFTK